MHPNPRSVFLSDTHLGAKDAQAEALFHMLRTVECDYLYLVGDIIDLWKIRSGWYWPQINTNIVQLVMDKARNGTRVIYVPGNHDETFRDYAGIQF
ncbi:MAG: UDP-2,3-diacylglucosamine diphosphatase, partial [Thiohalorhabdaceae bacterium]